MGCCPAAFLAVAAVTLRTKTECSDWCHLFPLKCAGFAFENANGCTFCSPDNYDPTCADGSVPVLGRTSQCFGDVCVACYDGLPIPVKRGTSVYISQTCNYYHPYNSIADSTADGKSIYLNMTTNVTDNVKLIGPGKVSAELPLRIEGNFSATKGITFEHCSNQNQVDAAAVITKNSIVAVEGYVSPAHAKVLVKIAPEQSGNRITVDADVFLRNSADPHEAAVGAVAVSHATGSVKAKCEHEKGYIISAELSTAKRQLDVDSANCNNINITALMNDFGSEYLAQFKNGPLNSAVAWSGTHILVVVAAILTVATLVIQQTHFTRLLSDRTRVLTAR